MDHQIEHTLRLNFGIVDLDLVLWVAKPDLEASSASRMCESSRKLELALFLSAMICSIVCVTKEDQCGEIAD
jgi:hypothetical protein